MRGMRPGLRSRRVGVLLVASTCALLAVMTAPAAAKSPRPRVASVRVKVPNLGDVTLARVVLKVKLVHGSRARRKRILRFSLVNGARLSRSLIVVVGGKRLTSTKAGVARLVAQTGQSATFAAAVAIFNPRSGAVTPRARQAAGVPPDTVATFEASTEGEDTVIVTTEFHQDILVNDQNGRVALCRNGTQVAYQFSRAAFDEVAGPEGGLTPEIIELLFDRAVKACFQEANTTGEQPLFEWLNPGMHLATPPGQPAFSGTFGGATNAEGDAMRIAIAGQFNRDISGVTIWAPKDTLFTNCDPTPTCKIGGYGGATGNSVYFMVNVLANHPFPPGLNVELNHAGNYSDTYQGQATATDGSTSPWVPFSLTG